MKLTKRRLSLNTVTLHRLDAAALEQAVGGAGVTVSPELSPQCNQSNKGGQVPTSCRTGG